MSGEIYRGPDRRRADGLLRRRMPRERAMVVLLGSVAVSLLAEAVVRAFGPADVPGPVADTLRIIATALFFGAGATRFARWRVTGEDYMAGSAVALIVFALATFPISVAVRALGAGTRGSALPSLARLVTALIVAAILVPALRSGEVDSTVRPVRALGYALAGTSAGFALMAVLLARDVPALLSSTPAGVAGDLLVATVWVGLALLAGRVGLRRRSASQLWSAVAFALLALGALAHGGSAAEANGMPWLVSSALLGALAGTVAFLNAVGDVQEALAGEGNELLITTGALSDAEHLLARIESRREETVHDARSMIASLRLASTTLDRAAGRLGAETVARLHAAMDVELARLGRLIEGANDAAVRAFDVAASLRPVLAMARGDGQQVVDRLSPATALGRPDDLAQVVHSLIANAHRHAPGSPVTVRVEALGDDVRVYVEDRGPGVPAGQRSVVFERGFTAGGGEGLGLYVARRLMRAQGGELQVQARPGGGASFVASLSSAGAEAMSHGSVSLPQPGEQVVECAQSEDLLVPLDALDSDSRWGARIVGQLNDHVSFGRARLTGSDDRHVERRLPSRVGVGYDGVAQPRQGEG